MIDLDAIAAGILDGSINERNLSSHLKGDEGFRLAVLRYVLTLTDAALNSGTVSSYFSPVWTFVASGPTDGQFTSDFPLNTTSTTQITFGANGIPKHGGGTETWGVFFSLLEEIPIHIQVANSDGAISVYSVDSYTSSEDGHILGVTSLITGYSTWEAGQDYVFSFIPGMPQSFSEILALSSITPVADGTYTVGIGGTQNGTITVSNGIITSIQEAQA